MSRKVQEEGVILYLPLNTFHSNVLPEKAEICLEETRAMLEWLKNLPFPVAISAQRIDLMILGLTEQDFEGLELLAAPWAHLMPSLFTGTDALMQHAQWQRDHGVHSNMLSERKAYFCPEFDIPSSTRLLPEAPVLLPTAGKSARLYSECSISDFEVSGPLSEHSSLRFHKHLLAPLIGNTASKITGAYFTYQRIPNDDTLETLVEAVRSIKGTGKTHIWFVDFEASFVGSHHGFSVMRKALKAIADAGLSSLFTSFTKAMPRFEAEAVKLPKAYSHICRDLGGKWTRWPMQLAHMSKVAALAELRRPRSDEDHLVMSLIGGSDVLSAMNSKIMGIQGARAFEAYRPDGMRRDIPLATLYNPDIIDIAQVAARAYASREDPARLLRALATDDKKPFAGRIAAVIDQIRDQGGMV